MKIGLKSSTLIWQKNTSTKSSHPSTCPCSSFPCSSSSLCCCEFSGWLESHRPTQNNPKSDTSCSSDSSGRSLEGPTSPRPTPIVTWTAPINATPLKHSTFRYKLPVVCSQSRLQRMYLRLIDKNTPQPTSSREKTKTVQRRHPGISFQKFKVLKSTQQWARRC